MEIPYGGWNLLPKSPTSEEPRGVMSKQASICLLFLAKWEEERGRAQDVPRDEEGPDLVWLLSE